MRHNKHLFLKNQILTTLKRMENRWPTLTLNVNHSPMPVEALDYHFQNQPNVYVSGDLLIYYEKGSSKKSVAPDVFVVFGVPKYDRKIYQTWAERKTPDVVIEIASPSTYKKDEKEKPELYQRLSVQEYFQYDPTGDYLPQPLRGRTLDDKGRYQDIPTETLKDGTKILTSRLLGLELRLEKYKLRVFDPLTEEYLFTYSEEADARRQAQKEAMHERKRKEWAQRDALLERQRADKELQQLAQREALLERQRAEQAQLKAEQERQRANKLAEQLRALGINLDAID
ncbi:MAG: Uma2 family endonuclease [Candidatus Parabeggiatoa sp. nov. 2]|nr:MAG: hypothetical protein B6247_01515 [Beggiatoa sp. 4572_84]RKZ63906.1 MAG: Uma2 family endonuclease [Gammaproteobacteria bacterium]